MCTTVAQGTALASTNVMKWAGPRGSWQLPMSCPSALVAPLLPPSQTKDSWGTFPPDHPAAFPVGSGGRREDCYAVTWVVLRAPSWGLLGFLGR